MRRHKPSALLMALACLFLASALPMVYVGILAGAEEKLIPLAGVNIGAGLFLVLASTIMAENGG